MAYRRTMADFQQEALSARRRSREFQQTHDPNRIYNERAKGWGTRDYEGQDKLGYENRKYIRGRLKTHKGQLMKYSNMMKKAAGEEGSAESRAAVIDEFKRTGTDTATGIGLLAGYARASTARHGELQSRRNLIGSMGKDYDEGYYDLVKAYSQDDSSVAKRRRKA